MPSIYAHHSFGEQVYSKLSPELKTIIHNHKDAFYAGLQGPDYLFFFHPLVKRRPNQLGYWQHRSSFQPFLQQSLKIIDKVGTDSNTYAYLLGFICHYMLDSECHSYVIPQAKKRASIT